MTNENMEDTIIKAASPQDIPDGYELVPREEHGKFDTPTPDGTLFFFNAEKAWCRINAYGVVCVWDNFCTFIRPKKEKKKESIKVLAERAGYKMADAYGSRLASYYLGDDLEIVPVGAPASDGTLFMKSEGYTQNVTVKYDPADKIGATWTVRLRKKVQEKVEKVEKIVSDAIEKAVDDAAEKVKDQVSPRRRRQLAFFKS